MGKLRFRPPYTSAATAMGLGGGLGTITSTGFDWFVDSVLGNDANTGRSPAQAFQTIAALMAAGISAGDKIGLARGSQWREQLDVAVNGVTIRAYGSGASPILDAGDVIANASFSKTVGQVNVYEASVTLAVAASKQWVNAWEDDEFLSRAASIAACDAAPGSYFPSAQSGAITLYVHASDSSDVTANGKIYEASVRQYGLNAQNRSGIVVNGITTQKQLHENGSLIVGRSGRVTDCNCDWGSKHNVFVSDGSLLTNVTCTNAYYGGTAGVMFIYNEDTPASLGITHANCTAQLTGNTVALSNDHISGFSGHINTSGDFGAVAYTNCTAVNVFYGFSDPQNNTSLTITNPTLTECTRAIFLNTATTTGGCTVSGGTWTGTGKDNGVRLSNCGGGVVVSNMAFNCENVVAAVFHAASGRTLTLNNCTFTDNTSTVGNLRSAIQVNHANASLVVNTCGFLGGNWRQYVQAILADTVKSDFNTFAEDNPGPSAMVMDGVSYSPISTAWLGANIAGVGDLDGVATQQDANSTILA